MGGRVVDGVVVGLVVVTVVAEVVGKADAEDEALVAPAVERLSLK